MSYFINMKNTSRKPYIYKVTNFETGQYYIGSQCSGKTIGVNYFTSSTNKAFKEGFKTYKEEKYKIEIIKEFDDPKKCGRVENYIIRNYMLKKDGLCLNKFYCCNGKKVFSNVGTHPSEETRKKIGKVNKGILRSEETKQKISRALKGQSSSEETKQKMSISKKGRPSPNKGIHLSQETKQKISRAKKGLPSSRRIKISIEGMVFDSLNAASKYYNVAIETIRRWLKNKNHNAIYAI